MLIWYVRVKKQVCFEEVLNRLASYIEKSNALKSKITGALWYPVATMVIAFGAILVVLIFVIPKFQELFADQGQSLPQLTQMVIDLSEQVKSKWYLVLATFIGVPVGLSMFYKTEPGRQIIDRIVIRIPIFGSLITKSCVARMSRTLSTLLKAGVQLIEAIDIAAGVAGNAVLEKDLNRAKESVIQGKTFVGTIKEIADDFFNGGSNDRYW